MKRIITISRQFGAAGSTIGRQVAARLGFEFYDKEIILRAARTSNLDMDTLLKWDEKIPANFGFAQSLFDFYNRPLGEQLYAAQGRVIRDIGEKGKCVIVGRNANHILREYENSLHVFIYADAYWRMEYMKKKMPDVSEARISEELHAIDRARKKYCYYHTSQEFGVAESYDLCMNVAVLGIDTCVDMICGIAERE